MVKRLAKSLRVSETILFDFFIVFSRFEFALKACGYVKTGKLGNAETDWNKFISCISKENEERLGSILYIGKYIVDNPPRLLIIKNGELCWNDVSARNKNNIGFLLNGVKRVRNNLFHGSKFNIHDLNLNSRNERLISCSLSVLRAVLALPIAAKISHSFDYSEITEEFQPNHGSDLIFLTTSL